MSKTLILTKRNSRYLKTRYEKHYAHSFVCAKCGLAFKKGDKIVSTSGRRYYYHQRCFDEMFY